MSSKEDMSGQVLEVVKICCQALNKADPQEEATQDLIEDPSIVYKFFKRQLNRDFNSPREQHKILAGWSKFYKEVFCFRIALHSLEIPPHRQGFNQLLVMDQYKIPLDTLLGVLAKKVRVRIIDQSPLNVEIGGRNSSSAIWVKKQKYPDKSDADFDSFIKTKIKKIHGESLYEHLLHFLFYYYQSGGRCLGALRGTVCIGSYFVVPREGVYTFKVGWDPEGGTLDICTIAERRPFGDYNGIREVVWY